MVEEFAYPADALVIVRCVTHAISSWMPAKGSRGLVVAAIVG
jgi:hypothetical protein